MIPFNPPSIVGREQQYLRAVLKNKKLSGDGLFSGKCQSWLEQKLGCQKVLLVPSGTAALEMAAILADIRAGDEAIMPSYTFSSTTNAFVLRGAKIVFVDIRPDTLNIDENLIEKAITKKTKAIVPVHYAGVGCEMEKILALAKKYHLLVIEDAAQGILAKYKGRHLGTIGDIGCFSFHETKNIACGEGGALMLNNAKFIKRAEIIREKGTNRSRFLRGEIDKYSWVDIGSSYLLSELDAAFLYAQLEKASQITLKRLESWNLYHTLLQPLAKKGLVELPDIPADCQSNAHIFYLKVQNLQVRSKLMNYLKKMGIISTSHYIPLHSSLAGRKYGRFCGKDKWTTKESERLLRLPMYNTLRAKDIKKVVQSIEGFFKK